MFSKIISIAVVLFSVSTAFAQIELSYTLAKSLVGVTTPRVIGERILVGADSKPQLANVAVIKVDCTERFRVKARKTLFETVDLVALSDREFLLAGEGVYEVEVISLSWDRSVKVVILPDVTPGPTPEPPKPDPKPPTPDIAPIPEPGLRVLIVYETDDLSSMSSEQSKILYSQAFRTFMSSVCTKVNGHPEWRVLDKDTVSESGIWQRALARNRSALPWIVVSNGTGGFEGPLPKTESEATELIRRYVK